MDCAIRDLFVFFLPELESINIVTDLILLAKKHGHCKASAFPQGWLPLHGCRWYCFIVPVSISVRGLLDDVAILFVSIVLAVLVVKRVNLSAIIVAGLVWSRARGTARARRWTVVG